MSKKQSTHLYTDGSDKKYAVVAVKNEVEILRFIGSVAGEKVTVINDRMKSAAALWATEYAVK